MYLNDMDIQPCELYRKSSIILIEPYRNASGKETHMSTNKNQNPTTDKQDYIRVSFMFDQDDWEALGFTRKPDALELKQAIYNLIHTISFDELPLVMGSREVAQLLDLNPQTIKIWAREGKLPATKIAGKWKFRREDILEYMKGHNGRAEQAKKIQAKEEEQERLRNELKDLRSRHH